MYTKEVVCNSCLRELCPLAEISFVRMALGHAIAEDAAAVFFSLQGDFVLNLGSENYSQGQATCCFKQFIGTQPGPFVHVSVTATYLRGSNRRLCGLQA